MQALQHVKTLKHFRDEEPYEVLDAIQFLKESGDLPKEWLALDNYIAQHWHESEINQEWAWGIKENESTTGLFIAWKFNKASLSGLKNKQEMKDQLNKARKEVYEIISGCPPPTFDMLLELSALFSRKQKVAIKEIRNLKF